MEELSFRAGEELDVLDKPPDDPNWWLCQNAAGQVGLVPMNYITVIRPLEPQPLSPALHPRVEEVRRSFLRGTANALRFAKQPWYWGSISRSQCEFLLTRLGNEGEFFVRDSESHVSLSLTVSISAIISRL